MISISLTCITILLFLIILSILGGIWIVYKHIYLNFVDMLIYLFHLIYTDAYGEPLINQKSDHSSKNDRIKAIKRKAMKR